MQIKKCFYRADRKWREKLHCGKFSPKILTTLPPSTVHSDGSEYQ